MKPIHRDDLPDDVIQGLESQFPGMKIVCVGDIPEGSVTDELKDAIGEIESRFRTSIVNGTCVDCGAKIPGYPTSDEEWDSFELPIDWRYFTDSSNGDPQGFQCPACDAKEGGG